VVDVSNDARQVLDALGHDRFVTIGWSGGGPHALACAADADRRCAGAAIVGGVAPYRADGLDWSDGMGPENIEEFSLAVRGGGEFTSFLTAEASHMGAITGAQVAVALGGLVSEVDRAALTGDFADYQANALRVALSRDTEGWYDDDVAFVSGWGFDLAAVECAVAVWQGGEDRMVPFAHGAWLAEHLPNARPHLLTAEGHLSLLVGRYESILDDLLELAA
jgi:pimeloyl-ACP methyl ester carboxylesterase